MKISNMETIFGISHRSNEAVRMEGLHGIGKSQVVESFASKNDFHLEILFLSQQEVGDLIGIPENKDGIMTWSKPIWLERLHEASAAGKHCVVFLDELARAPLDVRQASLQLVLEGKIHQHSLPTKDGLKTLIIAADNPSDLYSTDDLDAALLDRFSTYDVETDPAGWLSWGRMNELEESVTDFVAEYPDKLHFQNDKDKGSTPRAWAKLSDLLKNIQSSEKEFTLPIINSKVGETVGASFYHFYLNHHKIVSVDDIIEMVDVIAEETGYEDLTVQENQEKIAKKLSEVTLEMEAVSASELAEKFRKRITDGEKLQDYLVCLIGSLNLEVSSSINKSWKNEKSNEWFFIFNSAIPNQWITARQLAVAE